MDRHALEDQKNATNDRRVGLGILGLGDMLVKWVYNMIVKTLCKQSSR